MVHFMKLFFFVVDASAFFYKLVKVREIWLLGSTLRETVEPKVVIISLWKKVTIGNVEFHHYP
jgi:hypothetical protein